MVSSDDLVSSSHKPSFSSSSEELYSTKGKILELPVEDILWCGKELMFRKSNPLLTVDVMDLQFAAWGNLTGLIAHELPVLSFPTQCEELTPILYSVGFNSLLNVGKWVAAKVTYFVMYSVKRVDDFSWINQSKRTESSNDKAAHSWKNSACGLVTSDVLKN